MLQESQVFGKQDGQISGLLTTKETATFLGYSPRMLEVRRRPGGNGPRFVRISNRAIRYRFEDLQAWIEQRVKTCTTEK